MITDVNPINQTTNIVVKDGNDIEKIPDRDLDEKEFILESPTPTSNMNEEVDELDHQQGIWN